MNEQDPHDRSDDQEQVQVEASTTEPSFTPESTEPDAGLSPGTSGGDPDDVTAESADPEPEADTAADVETQDDAPAAAGTDAEDGQGDTPEEPAAVADPEPEADTAADAATPDGEPSPTGKTAGEEDEESASDEEVFDPAVDMPTYQVGMDWFVLRVASNKENFVREALLRKTQIEGLDTRVGRIMVPTEKTQTIKAGKARISETKLYPGYVFVEMCLEEGRIPQDVFFLIKETTGVGDFVGTAGRPTPMTQVEAEKMLFDSRIPEEVPEVKLEFEKGDNVTINEGPFENYEGTVDDVLPDKGLVRVLVTIFGRQAPVELEYWQISRVTD